MAPRWHLRKKKVDNLFIAWFTRNIDYQVLENLKFRFKSEHDLVPHSRRHAVMNILGFIHQKCHVVHAKHPPTGFFKQVLDEDPNNINALCALVHVYDSMGKKSEALKYQREYDRILQCDVEQQKRFYARFSFEQAMFMTSREESFLNKHYEAIITKFKTAISLGTESGVDASELDMWKYYLGFLYGRVDSVLDERCNENSIWLKSCLQLLYQIATRTTDHSLANAEGNAKTILQAHFDCCVRSWSYMGALLVRRYPAKDLKLSRYVEDIDPRYKDFNGFKCLENAVRIQPHSPTVLRRIGQAYTKRDDLMDEAFGYLIQAINAEPIGYSYSLLGHWYLTKYEKGRDKQHLEQAIKNYKLAIENKCDLFVLFKSLAKAHEYSGEIETALNVYQRCEDTYEGPRTVELYELWAELLTRIGSPFKADEKRQLAEATRQGRNPKQIRDFGVLYDARDVQRVTKFVETTERKFNVRGLFLERDVNPGRDVIDELSHMERCCRVIVLFLTENFNTSPSCCKQLNNIIHARRDKTPDTLVPLIVGKGVKPDSIGRVRAITYDSHSKAFWEKLGATIRKVDTNRGSVFSRVYGTAKDMNADKWVILTITIVLIAVVIQFVSYQFTVRFRC